MSRRDIRTALTRNLRYTDFPEIDEATDIAYENETFDPKGKQFWLEFTYVPSNNEQLSRGGATFREGFAQITAFSAKNKDPHNKRLDVLIEALIQAFHPQTVLEYNGQQVTITSIDDLPPEPSEDWYQAGITINYQSIVQGA